MEDDPIEKDQINVLHELLNDECDDDTLQGFLIICPRLVDSVGHHRTRELEKIFKTDTPQGRQSLKNSFKTLLESLGSYKQFVIDYPVSIIPANPVYPMLRIIGIETLTSSVYRALDSDRILHSTGEALEAYILRTGKLPYVQPPATPVLRAKLEFVHWCSYFKFSTPAETQEKLQIAANWNNCQMRATIATNEIKNDAYMAYNGDRVDPEDPTFKFYGYFYEPIAQDHPKQIGGEVQIKVFGEPRVSRLEKWNDLDNVWQVVL